MIFLLSASVIWALSFGLIGKYLVGMDSNLVAAIRLLLSLVVFLPFFRPKGIGKGMALNLLLVGAVQYGLMYVLYIRSYKYLPAHQVALLTVFTPLYVTLINDVIKRRFHSFFFVAALSAVLGTAVIKYSSENLAADLKGILCVQAANFCFAFGQIRYRDVMKGRTDRSVYALLYMGAAAVAVAAALFTVKSGDFTIGKAQILTLLYLGVIPSGICFFLWNTGARKTNPGTLAVMNNAKVPLAVVFAILITGAHPDVLRLVIGASIILFSAVFNELMLRRTEKQQL